MAGEPLELPFEGLTLVTRFLSRKNSVYLVRRDGERFILKVFASDRADHEYRVLQDAYDAGIPVPRPVKLMGRSILMQYIEGRTIIIRKIDRAVAGYVVDFVDVYWGGTHFWAFNVADSAFTVGAILVLLDMIGVGRRHASHPV
jgi:hypothetical protein